MPSYSSSTNSRSKFRLEDYQVEAASFGQTNCTELMKCAFESSPPSNSSLFCPIPPLRASREFFHDDLNTVSRGMVVVLRKRSSSSSSVVNETPSNCDDHHDANELFVLFAKENAILEECQLFRVHPISIVLSNNSLKIELMTAFYGPKDVTQKCAQIIQQSIQNSDEISIHASNHVFGDTWPDVFKSLTIVYRKVKINSRMEAIYGPIRMKIAQEHESIKLLDELDELDEMDEHFPSFVPTSVASIRQNVGFVKNSDDEYGVDTRSFTLLKECHHEKPIQIIRAVYGFADVTRKVLEFLNDHADRLRVAATNDIFGDSWPGVVKYLTVFYKLRGSNHVYVASCIEHDTLDLSFESTCHQAANSDENSEWDKVNGECPPLFQIHAAMHAQLNCTKKVKHLLENSHIPTKIYSMASSMQKNTHVAPLVVLYSIRGKIKLIVSLDTLCFNRLFRIGNMYDKAHQSDAIFRATVQASRNGEPYHATLRMNRKRQEILVTGQALQVPIVLMQNWFQEKKEHSSPFRNMKNNERMSFDQLFSLIFRIRVSGNGSIQVNDHFLEIDNFRVKFRIALFEVYSEDLLRNQMPCYVRRLIPEFLDGSIPDSPGLSFSPLKVSNHQAVIQLHDIDVIIQ
nr:unnamed protein product [Naegleria fowleri]